MPAFGLVLLPCCLISCVVTEDAGVGGQRAPRGWRCPLGNNRAWRWGDGGASAPCRSAPRGSRHKRCKELQELGGLRRSLELCLKAEHLQLLSMKWPCWKIKIIVCAKKLLYTEKCMQIFLLLYFILLIVTFRCMRERAGSSKQKQSLFRGDSADSKPNSHLRDWVTRVFAPAASKTPCPGARHVRLPRRLFPALRCLPSRACAERAAWRGDLRRRRAWPRSGRARARALPGVAWGSGRHVGGLGPAAGLAAPGLVHGLRALRQGPLAAEEEGDVGEAAGKSRAPWSESSHYRGGRPGAPGSCGESRGEGHIIIITITVLKGRVTASKPSWSQHLHNYYYLNPQLGRWQLFRLGGGCPFCL